MTPTPTPPAEALITLRARLVPYPWFRGADLQGVGLGAIIVVRTTRLQEAQAEIDRLDGRWCGYRLEPRRVE